LHLGIEYAAAAAMVASVLGELASLAYLFMIFKVKKKFPVRKNFFKSVKSGKQTLKELMEVALPATGSRMIGSLAWFFEPIVVSHSLFIAGIAAGVATKQYGLLTGYALPLLMLPSFITYSLSTSLVPAISEANANRNHGLVEHRLQQALRFALLTGGLAVVVLYVFAKPLMTLMYGSPTGFEFIRLMAPFFIFHYYQGPLQAILQALDLASAAMINSLIGAVFKIAVIFVLATQPQFGINGAALGIAAGTVLVTLLHFATVLKKIQFTIYLLDYGKFIVATVLAGILGSFCYKNILIESPYLIRLLFGIIVITVSYLLFTIMFKLLTKNDLLKIPFINRFIQ